MKTMKVMRILIFSIAKIVYQVCICLTFVQLSDVKCEKEH